MAALSANTRNIWQPELLAPLLSVTCRSKHMHEECVCVCVCVCRLEGGGIATVFGLSWDIIQEVKAGRTVFTECLLKINLISHLFPQLRWLYNNTLDLKLNPTSPIYASGVVDLRLKGNTSENDHTPSYWWSFTTAQAKQLCFLGVVKLWLLEVFLQNTELKCVPNVIHPNALKIKIKFTHDVSFFHHLFFEWTWFIFMII